MRLVVLSFVALAACSGQEDAPAPAPAPAPVTPTPVRADAAPPGITTISGFDPRSGMHLDEGVPHHRTPPEGHDHAHRPIDVILRSTPTGAHAAVDGVPVGDTPAYWSGDADGHPHEFTFVLPGYAVARYRFVPITSGVVHARLQPVADDHSDQRPPPEVVPAQPRPGGSAEAPSPGPTTPAPPPTIVAPVDGPATPPGTDAAPVTPSAPSPGFGPAP